MRQVLPNKAGALKQAKLSDTSGQFQFLINEPGSYSIRLSSVGSSTNLNEVKVEGKKPYIEQRIDITVLSPLIFRSNAPTKVNILSAKADYNYPLSASAKFSAGIKSSYVKTDNDIVFENYNGATWQNDLNRSNQFQYTEHINAAYLNLQWNLKIVELQLGLRAEQTSSKGNSITLNEIVDTDYLNLFPTVFLRNPKSLRLQH